LQLLGGCQCVFLSSPAMTTCCVCVLACLLACLRHGCSDNPEQAGPRYRRAARAAAITLASPEPRCHTVGEHAVRCSGAYSTGHSEVAVC
jgi:hypothetical protein